MKLTIVIFATVLLLSNVGLVFVLYMVLRRTGGYAPGWRARCTSCGKTKSAEALGIVRIGAKGNKRVLGWCTVCRAIQCVAIERDAVTENLDSKELLGSK